MTGRYGRRMAAAPALATISTMLHRCCLGLLAAIVGGGLVAGLVSLMPAGTPSTASADDDGPHAAVRQHVVERMTELEIPGLAVAVVADDRIAFAEGFGVADVDGRPVEADTPFAIGSVSKTITAVAVLRLADAGLVELDAPVSTYLPRLVADGAGAGADPTLVQLLTHTSGLSTADGLRSWGDPGPGDGGAEAGEQALAASLRESDPGRFQYSNANYDLLGMVVEAVTGRTYADAVASEVFRPLEMGNSFADWTDARAAGMAKGHYRFFDEVTPHDVPVIRSALPSAFLVSSAEDLAHLAIALLDDGTYGSTQILAPSSAALMQRPVVRRGSHVAQTVGLRIEPFRGGSEEPGLVRMALRHGGDLATFAADLILLPGDGLAVVVLANLNDTSAPRPYHETATGIASLLLGSAPEPITAGAAAPAALGKPLLLFVVILQLALATHPRHGHRAIAAAHDALPTVVAGIVVVGFVAALLSTPSVPLPGVLRQAPDVALAVLAVAALGIPALQPRGLRRSARLFADGHGATATSRAAPVDPFGQSDERQSTASVQVTSSG